MKSIADIKAIRDKMQADKTTRETSKDGDVRIVVGMATCGIAAGARPVLNAFVEGIGMCKLEPIVEVFVPGEEKVTYVKVDADKAVEIIEKHIVGGNVVEEYLLNE